MAKDLRQHLRNSGLIVFAVALPLGLAFIFNLVLGDAGERFTARYAVADQDGGELARQFTEQTLRPLERDGVISLRTIGSPDEGDRLVENREIEAAFVIPAGFTADVEAGRPATLRVIGNVDSAIAVQVAREIGAAYAADKRGVALAVAAAGQAGDPAAGPSPEATGGPGAAGQPDPAAALAERAAALPAPVGVTEDSSAATRELDSRTYYAAGMAFFFLFFSLLFTVTGILDERAGGTLPRLLAAPIRPPAILLGKLASGVLIGVASMAVLVVASTLLLGASWGDPLGVAALIVAGVLAATGIMSVVAVYARTSEQASNWQSAIAMVLGVLGGALFPVAQLGGLAEISYLTPHRWFLSGLAELAGGGSVDAVLLPVTVLLCFALAGAGIALLRAGRLVRS
ncbi:ABC transporter permease [Solwaraspora sp. WMMD1047]|uniref:ABC transporter permease n=1 Tax=Solwaraspora sp. WMMD1047 TaxID=3016102 RepID=UPI0024172703|nr:ABC transporter permease [Solwaraspora sp. WMMD1047]MDG4827771.1 ABC transporter permease [Solwaraspora sp. WMMD1047]